MFEKKLIIQENCIQITNPIDGTIVFTIWSDDFERYKKAFQDSENYKKEMIATRKKYEN